jgi:putative (di)nucleoside polyphosphate hydrolase
MGVVMAKGQTFRANVGVVVLNERWQVLALERIDKKALKKGVARGTGQWQMPQGGLEDGEEPESAWMRELHEETSIRARDRDLVGSYPEWLAYELPKSIRQDPSVNAKQGRGQVQKWFFVRLPDHAKINLNPKNRDDQEFFDYKWMSLKTLAETTWEVRRPIYRKLALYLAGLKRAVSREAP